MQKKHFSTLIDDCEMVNVIKIFISIEIKDGIIPNSFSCEVVYNVLISVDLLVLVRPLFFFE